MVDEIYEINQYLSGNNIDKKNLHRTCYLLAKFFKEEGMSHLEIRQSIFQWGEDFGVYFPFSVNSVIYHALSDSSKLRGEVPVYITQSDIKEIINRFDKKNCKYVALAILCYAKVASNSDNEVVISTMALSHWLDIHQQNISNRYIPELIDFDFMESVGEEEGYFMWDKSKPISKNRRYKIKVELKNSPEPNCYELKNNNIKELCKKIFG